MSARFAAVLSILALWPALAAAHKPSDSYLSLTADGAAIRGHFDIALRDLDQAIGLDGDDDGSITWGELRARQPAVDAYALSHLQFRADGKPCSARVASLRVDHHTDGAYAVLQLEAPCERPPTQLGIEYTLFFDFDPQHRGLVQLERAGATSTAIFSIEEPRQMLSMAQTGFTTAVPTYVREGVWHIWIGYDHVLFLLSLLLPAVLCFEAGSWRPAPRLRPALADVLRIVTAFTVAHSITLSLAVLGVLNLPSRWVESAIAASVVLAAMNNLFPVVGGRRWAVAFGFGLVHGLGFASVLADLGLPRGSLLPSLLGFNLGVELGQLAIVALFLPLAWRGRSSLLYRRFAFGLGSTLIAIVASIWLLERSLDLRLVLPL